MKRLLKPRSVAIVGASSTPGAFGAEVKANLERARYQGTIYLINRKRKDIGGRQCLSTIDELPVGVDCVILAIPRAGVFAALAACVRRQVGSVIIFAAGFADAGAAGRVEQQRLREIAVANNILIEGPNCLGVVNYIDAIPLTFVVTAPQAASQKPGIAIVSQSGAIAAVLGVSLRHHDLPLSYSVTTGNEAASGVEDFLGFMVDDKNTSVIALIVDQFRKPQALLQVAARAQAAGKRIVLLHPGSTRAAQASATTHTGALAGDYRVMRARVEHAGILVVDTLEELIDVTDILWRCPALESSGTAVFTESGAVTALTLDFCERLSLPLPSFEDRTKALLCDVLPDFIQVSNPFDLTAHSLVDPDLYRQCLPPMLADARIGSLVLAIILTDEQTSGLKFPPILAAIRASRSNKPILFAALDEGAVIDRKFVDELRALGVPFFPSSERAFRALVQVDRHASRLLISTPILEKTKHRGLLAGTLPEHKSKRLLSSAGIPTPPGALATSVEEALKIADRIGYPVVLKAQSAKLPHKNNAGGVMLQLVNAEAVRAAWTQLHAALSRSFPDLKLDGILVEQMAPPGLELILGARTDKDWGPVLMVGLGGIAAEVLGDNRLLMPGLSREAIVAEILCLKAAPLLREFRGAPALDVEAVADIVMRLDELITANPEIREVDLNPIIVYPRGQGAMALDALIVVQAS